jgi:hypothetical protein
MTDALPGLRAGIEQTDTSWFEHPTREAKPQTVPLGALPANANPTVFPTSRVRGAFEQLYPKPW